ncbi:MAG: ACT domain-containing protein [Verrucomicrobiae bacterium]|nr:ACT domain-containing protein [Verrucomicrobiae bacterium]
MEITTQLALFLNNRPGALARVCSALSDAGINILAFSMSDTVDHTVLRMVVSDPRRALALFEERGALVVESEVLLLHGNNRPGALAAIARKLSAARINIEYAYSATSPNERSGLLVMRVTNYRKALKILNTAAKAKA